jgi:hypothetical protein
MLWVESRRTLRAAFIVEPPNHVMHHAQPVRGPVVIGKVFVCESLGVAPKLVPTLWIADAEERRGKAVEIASVSRQPVDLMSDGIAHTGTIPPLSGTTVEGEQAFLSRERASNGFFAAWGPLQSFQLLGTCKPVRRCNGLTDCSLL